MVSHSSRFLYAPNTPVPSSSSSLCWDVLYRSPTVPAPCQSRDNMRWQPQPSVTPVYTWGTEGDSTNLTHTSPSYPIISNPSVNRKQSNDRSWSDQGSASTPNNPPPFKQTSRLWASVASLRGLQRRTDLSRKLQRSAHSCSLFYSQFLGFFSLLFGCGGIQVKEIRKKSMIVYFRLLLNNSCQGGYTGS